MTFNHILCFVIAVYAIYYGALILWDLFIVPKQKKDDFEKEEVFSPDSDYDMFTPNEVSINESARIGVNSDVDESGFKTSQTGGIAVDLLFDTISNISDDAKDEEIKRKLHIESARILRPEAA